MSRTQIRVSLDRLENEQLRSEAARRGLPPATLAAEFIREGVAKASRQQAGPTSAAELKRWLGPILDEIRDRRGWPHDVTVQVFDLIRDQALDLYEGAAAEIDRKALNSEIGRLVKQRLGARVLRDAKRRPQTIKVGRKRGSLIQRATLLEPDNGAQS
jgi:hypothetical protein